MDTETFQCTYTICKKLAVEYISLLQDRDQSMEQELISLKQQVEHLKENK